MSIPKTEATQDPEKLVFSGSWKGMANTEAGLLP